MGPHIFHAKGELQKCCADVILYKWTWTIAFLTLPGTTWPRRSTRPTRRQISCSSVEVARYCRFSIMGCYHLYSALCKETTSLKQLSYYINNITDRGKSIECVHNHNHFLCVMNRCHQSTVQEPYTIWYCIWIGSFGWIVIWYGCINCNICFKCTLLS